MWWQEAVVYQIYPRSYFSTGTGVGDLRGIIERLDHIVDLCVDAIWMSPVYCSPHADHGYDVSDYFDIDPLFGTMADFDDLLAAAHARGLRVLLDMVPNHTSDQHAWFIEAVQAGPGSAARDRYLFRDGRGPDGSLPPTDTVCSFGGGTVWTRITEADGTPGQWYFHLFTPEQPDLNWAQPQVLAEFERIWRFWLDKGVDGFRVDVADHLTKDVDRTDMPEGNQLLEHDGHNRTHQVWQHLRRVLDSYDGQRTAVGEVWARGAEHAGYAVDFPTTFAFDVLKADWDAAKLRAAISGAMWERDELGATPAWVVDNHDTPRTATRLGPGQTGVHRSLAMTQLLLSLPGSVYLYQGQELGLPNVDDLPDEVLADPIWARSDFTDRGRDGCRVPLPWSGDEPSFGFAPPGVKPWLPQPAAFADLTIERQRTNPDSFLNTVRKLVRLRHEHPALRCGSFRWLDSPDGVLAFERSCEADRVVFMVNMSDTPVSLPAGTVVAGDVRGQLPPDRAVWLAGA